MPLTKARERRPKRKPTPPRCARQPLPREGARVDTPSFLWKEVPRRGGGWMGIPLSPKHSLPLEGKVASKASRIGQWRYEKEWGNASQVRRLREHPIHRYAVPLPQWGRLRNEDTAFLDTTPFPRGEGKEEAASPQKRKPTPPRCARQPLPREGARVDTPSLLPMEGGAPKGRRLDGGSGMKKSGKIVLSASFTKAPERRYAAFLPQRGRQRGGGLRCPKRKPTPPCCARQPLPREGARVDAPSFLWKEVPRRGGGWMGMAV